LPYIARLEKSGIPCAIVDLEDQHEMVKQNALTYGVPKLRFLAASRTIHGELDVDRFMEPMLKMLTDPLTDEEKEGGMHNPPFQRVLFEGTMEEAEKIYYQTEYVPHPLRAPISIYTDGLPIILPTEVRRNGWLKC